MEIDDTTNEWGIVMFNSISPLFDRKRACCFDTFKLRFEFSWPIVEFLSRDNKSLPLSTIYCNDIYKVILNYDITLDDIKIFSKPKMAIESEIRGYSKGMFSIPLGIIDYLCIRRDSSDYGCEYIDTDSLHDKKLDIIKRFISDPIDMHDLISVKFTPNDDHCEIQIVNWLGDGKSEIINISRECPKSLERILKNRIYQTLHSKGGEEHYSAITTLNFFCKGLVSSIEFDGIKITDGCLKINNENIISFITTQKYNRWII